MMEEARSQRHNDDDGDFGEEWDVDEYDDELYEQNGKDDDYEDDLADQYLVRKHTADELSDYTPHSRIMRNAGQRSQERRQWEQAFPARRIPRNGRGSQPPPILPPLVPLF
jgi:hypothetical protein